jgi:hypothetical protein
MECSLALEGMAVFSELGVTNCAIAVQSEAAAKNALLDAKDILRESGKRKNSSKNTSKSSQPFVLCQE